MEFQIKLLLMSKVAEGTTERARHWSEYCLQIIQSAEHLQRVFRENYTQVCRRRNFLPAAMYHEIVYISQLPIATVQMR